MLVSLIYPNLEGFFKMSQIHENKTDDKNNFNHSSDGNDNNYMYIWKLLIPSPIMLRSDSENSGSENEIVTSKRHFP